MKLAFALLGIFIMATAYFFGEPKLKERVANMGCDAFLTTKPWSSIEAFRGRVALAVAGGDMVLLADNCATYPGKPMGLYFGWNKYVN